MLREALTVFAVGCAAAWLGGCGFDPWVWLVWDLELVLSPTELNQYTGGDGSRGLYLAVLGQVFDVQQGHKHYGPGGSYSFFSGKDASRAFATGDFTPVGLVDDIAGLSPSEMLAIQNWLSFYHKNYVLVGKVVGRFYDASGKPTETLKRAQTIIEEEQRVQALQEEEKKRFPPCNSEWRANGGSRVWCSKQSGGVSRVWSGVPRKMYGPGASQSYCVCVNVEEQSLVSKRGDSHNPNLQQYEGCHPLAESCVLKD